MSNFVNKSEDRQRIFNEIRGKIIELNDGEKFCSVTIRVGHDNKRDVNLSCKKVQFDEIIENYELGDRVLVRYFLSSRKKERWYTMANILGVYNM